MLQFTSNHTKLVTFRAPGILDTGNDWEPMQTGKESDAYMRTLLCSIPTALALSFVVLCRMMMEMLSDFRFSEAFSK